MPLRRRAALLIFLVPAYALSARAQEVGQVDQAQKALGIFAERTWALAANEPVRVGLTISLPEPKSSVDVGLDVPVSISEPTGTTRREGSFHSEGPRTAFTIEEARWEEKPRKLLLGLKLDRGTLWMALSHLLLHQVWILTPQLTARPQGTSFRMLVDPIVGTFLAADEGSVEVAVTDTGESFRVTAGHWLLVPPRGTIQRGANDRAPRELDDPPLVDCCDFRTGPPSVVP